LLLAGDVNIHLDDLLDTNTVKFQHTLDLYGLIQHLSAPTHRGGHCIDVLVSSSSLNVASVRIDPPLALSDHSQILVKFDLKLQAEHPTKYIARQCWRTFDLDSFITDLNQSALLTTPPSAVDELFNCYDSTLRTLLDRHAPLRLVRVRVDKSARWFDAECHAVKRKTRRLERELRRHPSLSNRLAWRQQGDRMRKLFQLKAHWFWTSAVSSYAGDSRAVWSKVNALLSPPAAAASSGSLSAVQFAHLFTAKVQTTMTSTAHAQPPVLTPRTADSKLSTFRPVTHGEIKRMLLTRKAKHCDLDLVPTWLVKKLIDQLTPVITSICNASIESCLLPANQKRAIVRRIRKKLSLDASEPQLLSSNIQP
jgi:hypothetical protein